MCEITGFISSELNAFDKKKNHKEMSNKLSHRGPDAECFCYDSNIALGHRRLKGYLSHVSKQIG